MALEEEVKIVSRHVDRHIAHSDLDPAPVTPKFSDLDGAIDVVGHLFKKYANLLTAGTWVDLKPTPQDDWLAIFRVPWMPER